MVACTETEERDMTLVLKADRAVDGSPSEAAVDSGQLIIGRLPSNHIVIASQRVEPIHAMVERDEETGDVRLMDMASEEGITVNGKKVDVVVTIKAGDIIQIGDVSLTVREIDAEEFMATSAMATQADAIDEAGGIEAPPSRLLETFLGHPSQVEAPAEAHGSADEDSNQDELEVGYAADNGRGQSSTTVSAPVQSSAADAASRRSESQRASRVEGAARGSAGAQNVSSIRAAAGSGLATGAPALGRSQASAAVGRETEVPRENLFAPGKERPGGSTLEVVAFWEDKILDVRHYGGRAKAGEDERPTEVYIGNEEHGHLIGVGPKANTRNYLLGRVDGAKTKVYLNGEMRAKVRRSDRVERVTGPAKFDLTYKEMAIVKHGPLNYYLKNVSLPNPVLRFFQDADGRPVIFVYAFLIYALMVGGIMTMPPKEDKDIYDEELWAQVLTIRTPTPKPEKPTPPPPKPVVEVQKPKVTPPPAQVPKPTPAPIVADRKPTATDKTPPPVQKPEVKTPPKVVSLDTPQKPAQKSATDSPDKANAKGRTKDVKDRHLGPQNAAKAPGNSGGKAGGTSGAFASKRQGTSANDQMGVEGGKPNVMSGINLAKLGAGIGAVSDKDGIGAIATGLKSQAGGAGGGSGSAARSSGFGGLGQGSSLNTGGVGKALDGLGGGGGGAGAGGLGDPEGRGQGAGRRIAAQAVVVPQGDPAIEGALTKEEIDAVIKQNLAQIRACYERNLQGNRGLAGRVKVAFVIVSTGRVSSSEVVSSDLNNGATEGCIRDVIRRWQFPLPRGGGIVNVNYPFVFTPR
jgi:TonB family protein